MSTIPDELVVETTRWLDDVEAALGAAASVGTTLGPEMAARLAAAVGDVQDRTARFRDVVEGRAVLGALVASRWVPLGAVGRPEAERLHHSVIKAAEMPDEFVERAQTLLFGETRSGFLRHVGDIQSAVFLNLGWGMWSQHRDLFPENWVTPDEPEGSTSA